MLVSLHITNIPKSIKYVYFNSCPHLPPPSPARRTPTYTENVCMYTYDTENEKGFVITEWLL